MIILANDIFITPPAMGHHANQVGLCSRWQKKPRFFAHQLSGFGFKGVGGGVIAINIIPQFRVLNGGQHPLVRAGDGITAKIRKIGFVV